MHLDRKSAVGQIEAQAARLAMVKRCQSPAKFRPLKLEDIGVVDVVAQRPK
jgi:hypothetical protein